jgi:DNA-directed RNA polymerase subunit M/transcription elongation factor TFIIS
MRRYPLLVKIVHGKTALIEDDYGMYGRIVQEWNHDGTQFHIITCDEELCDLEESCATSEGADSMVILGHLDCADLEPLGMYLLEASNQNNDRSALTCPKCGSDDIIISDTDGDADDLYETMHCPSCDTEWTNYYRLYGQQIE